MSTVQEIVNKVISEYDAYPHTVEDVVEDLRIQLGLGIRSSYKEELKDCLLELSLMAQEEKYQANLTENAADERILKYWPRYKDGKPVLPHSKIFVDNDIQYVDAVVWNDDGLELDIGHRFVSTEEFPLGFIDPEKQDSYEKIVKDFIIWYDNGPSDYSYGDILQRMRDLVGESSKREG